MIVVREKPGPFSLPQKIFSFVLDMMRLNESKTYPRTILTFHNEKVSFEQNPVNDPIPPFMSSAAEFMTGEKVYK